MAIQGDFVCGNGHARSNPEALNCPVCGSLLKPDKTRGDISAQEVIALQQPSQSLGKFGKGKLL